MKLPARIPILAVVLTALLPAGYSIAGEGVAPVEYLPPLPRAVSNNGVALLHAEEGFQLFSMLGLEAGKSWRDTSSLAFRFSSKDGEWTGIDPVPGPGGRLAASAAVAGGVVYLFGGYTVAEDGSEQSVPTVHRFDQADGKWQHFSDMPVPVEDSVLLVYQDRYIYLVSGWHDLGNVNLVQVLDTQSGEWQQATPWPGSPVFGQAGAMHGGRLLVCDGVRIAYSADGSPRKFLPSSECWQGTIDTDNFRRINWQAVEAHPGAARYRMAAGADAKGRIYFAGGSVNPYNFNGTGYDGQPSEPESSLFSYDFGKSAWSCNGELAVATMDHRGLPYHDGWFYLVGGMRTGQEVSPEVLRFRPAQARKCPAERP